MAIVSAFCRAARRLASGVALTLTAAPRHVKRWIPKRKFMIHEAEFMKSKQPDLKLLATFLAVVGRGSMAEAAAALGYVPSAVSQHIAALERDMGIELIVRRPGSRLILTAAGRALVEAAE
ncbi:MAG TPA: LysR family transcriptional regulator, partial [Gemmatimonadales bacterium]|nr:LysR family transcriptional regulator [Gemmatimonadales bacterium]